MIPTDDIGNLVGSALRFREMQAYGQDSFSATLVVGTLVDPLLKVVKGMPGGFQRWLTLTEAIQETGRSRKYFEKPLASLGGLSRLEHWAKQELADVNDQGMWHICPLVLVRADRSPTSEDPEQSAGPEEEDDLLLGAEFDEMFG